jgi:poly(3-hydroxybutyrate) depolymerase
MSSFSLPAFLAAALVFSPVATAAFTPINGKMASPKTLNAMVHLPEGYDPGDSQGYPLLIALHGNGKCGDASVANGDGSYSLDMNILNKAISEGAPKMIRDGLWDNTLPFIVLAPQLPPNAKNECGMHKDRYEMIYKHATENFNVNLNKVYITGLSQGGNGTYNIIKDRPDTIAAAVPIAAWFPHTFNCEAIKDIGVWAFHGDQDKKVGYKSGQHVVDVKLNGCAAAGTPLNHPAKLTSFAGVAHDSWDGAYGVKPMHSFADGSKRHYYLELAYDHNDPNIDAAGNFGDDGYYYHYNEFGRHLLYRWLLSFTKPTLDGPNQPPLFNELGPVALQEGETLALDVSAVDPEGEALTLELIEDATGFASFVDNGNSSGSLTLSPGAGSQGSYALRLRATDPGGESDDLVVSLQVEQNAGAGDGKYLRLSGENISWNQFRLFKDSLWSGDFDLLAMGQQRLVLHLKNLGQSPLDKLHIQLNDSVNNKDYGVALADFAILDNDWTRVEIPLGEFANRGVDLQHFLSLRLFFGPNASVDLAVDEIKFSGAGEDFVLFGAQHRSSAWRSNGNLNAAEVDGEDIAP